MNSVRPFHSLLPLDLQAQGYTLTLRIIIGYKSKFRLKKEDERYIRERMEDTLQKAILEENLNKNKTFMPENFRKVCCVTATELSKSIKKTRRYKTSVTLIVENLELIKLNQPEAPLRRIPKQLPRKMNQPFGLARGR